MKKMLALLLALMLALSCTLAVAETANAPAAPATTFNGITIESEYDVDRAALTDLLTKLGMDEGTVKIFDAIAAILDQAGEKLVIAKNGGQFELLLKGTSLVNALVQVNEKDVTFGSNLIPNYAFKVSFEEIGGMLLNEAEERNAIMENLDMPAIQEALNTHITEFVATCSSAVIPGEVKKGDFVQDGVSYNVLMPMKVDVPTMVEAANNLVTNLENDEAIQTALIQLALMGVNVNFEKAEDGTIELIDPAHMPAVNVEVYMNVDDQGVQSGPTQVSVFVTPAGETSPATIVNTKVNGNNIVVDCQLINANSTITYAMDSDPANPLALNARMDAYINGFYFGLAAVTSANDQAIDFDAFVYVVDSEKAIAEEHGAITMNGELTLKLADDARALTLADLTGEDANNAIGGLGMDLLLNGLGNLISTATNLMPEEIGLISSLFSAGTETAEQPAA